MSSTSTPQQGTSRQGKRPLIDYSTSADVNESEPEISWPGRKEAKVDDESGPSSVGRPGVSIHSTGVCDKKVCNVNIHTSLRAAMHNPLALAKVVKALPTETLWKLRRTSRLWNRCFLPELRERGVTPPRLYTNNLGNWKVAGEGPDQPISSFTDLARSSLAIPFTSYQICNPTGGSSDELKDFFDVCGSKAWDLTFSISSVREVFNLDQIRQIIFEWTQLESLTIRTSESKTPIWDTQKYPFVKQIPNLVWLTWGMGDNPAYASLLKDVLTNAVNLEYLHISTQYYKSIADGGPEVHRILSTLADSSQHINKLKMIKLPVLDNIGWRILIDLARRKQNPLRLEAFTVSVLCNGGNGVGEGNGAEIINLFYSFLAMQSETLRTIEIDVIGLYSSTPVTYHPIRIPSMDNLQTFVLKKCHQDCFMQYQEPLIGQCFPKLNRFEYPYSGFMGPNHNDLDQMVHAGVTELSLGATFNDVDLRRLGLQLPAVTHLEMTIQSNQLGRLTTIWSVWPGLISLDLYISTDYSRFRVDENSTLVFNQLISGVPMYQFKILESELNSEQGAITLEKISLLLAKYKTQPGISDLKHLQRFCLQFNKCIRSACRITDIGGYFGLAMASSRIQIMAVEKTLYQDNQNDKLSDHCLALIKSAFGPYAVINVD